MSNIPSVVHTLATEGWVQQYVGDEVVISWKMEEAFENSNCFRFFYEYYKQLELKEAYFIREYGVMPTFKAGMHGGLVTATQVGELKTEIAYHGDVLNTAARIQSLCNKYDEGFLVSEFISEKASENKEFKTIIIGNLQLKGKMEKVKVFAVKNMIGGTVSM